MGPRLQQAYQTHKLKPEFSSADESRCMARLNWSDSQPGTNATRAAPLGLARVLELHEAWLGERSDGVRANLKGQVFNDCKLRQLNLRKAVLNFTSWRSMRTSAALI